MVCRLLKDNMVVGELEETVVGQLVKEGRVGDQFMEKEEDSDDDPSTY